MIDINNALREFNALNSNINKNNIDKLIDLIRIDQKTNNFFSSEIIFTFSILSAISIQIIFEKIIEFFIKAFKIMYFNNTRTIIINKI